MLTSYALFWESEGLHALFAVPQTTETYAEGGELCCVKTGGVKQVLTPRIQILHAETQCTPGVIKGGVQKQLQNHPGITRYALLNYEGGGVHITRTTPQGTSSTRISSGKRLVAGLDTLLIDTVQVDTVHGAKHALSTYFDTPSAFYHVTPKLIERVK